MQLPYYVADILSRFPVSWIEFFHLLFVCIYFGFFDCNREV